MFSFSLIILTLKTSEALVKKMQGLVDRYSNLQVVIVEASASPQSVVCCSSRLCLAQALKGRGLQASAGARLAQGEILIFLHADTDLPDKAFEMIEKTFQDPRVQAACFRLRFDLEHWLLNIYGFFTRFDSPWTSFGDQGIVVRRAFFDQVGGFPDWPLFEDVAFFQRARKLTRIVKMPLAVTTSAIRYKQNGIVRQQIKNFWLILRYCFGVSANDLARDYEKEREAI